MQEECASVRGYECASVRGYGGTSVRGYECTSVRGCECTSDVRGRGVNGVSVGWGLERHGVRGYE